MKSFTFRCIYFFPFPYLLYLALRIIRLKAMRAACLCGGCFSPVVFYLCVSALICGCFSSASYASPPPSHEGHVCKVLDYEEIRARNSRSTATKQALNLNIGEPRTVRMIYFLPNDRPFRQEVVDSMKVAIRQIQTFFADQMEAHGYGRKTFRFETDAQGVPLIHHVDGQHPNSYYLGPDGFGNVWDELGETFDVKNIFWVNISANRAVGSRFTKNSGLALFPDIEGLQHDNTRFKWDTEAHELGHAFGLRHDFRDSAYLMSYGPGQDRLSACHAEFLSVHPYFNPDIPIEEISPPTIELISPPTYPRGSTSVSIQLKVSDSEGLHQVILHGEPYGEVRACRGLNGETETIVEFDYDVNTNSTRLMAHVIDTHGNFRRNYFELICENCPQTLVKISGDNQQGLTNAQLNNPFVVETRDQDGNVLVGVPVTFTVTAGNGKLSGKFTVENTTTNANGRAQSTLTLGPNPGTSTVAVSITGSEPVTFNAVGVGTPTTPITGGEYQKWHLPDGAIARLGKGKIGQSDRSVAFSPDGQRLAVASHIGVWLYDVATSRELALFKTEGKAQSVAFSHDGTILASNTGSVKLWNLSTKEHIATLLPLRVVYGHSHVVAFSPDGATLASGGGHSFVDLNLWDITTGENIAILKHTDDVRTLAFSPDGKMLASGGGRITDCSILLWDVETRTNITTLEGHKDRVNSVAFSPNGATLASGAGFNSGAVKLWDVATGKNIATFRHTERVNSVAFSPDGATLASGAGFNSGAVKLWDVATGKNIATFRHIDAVRSVVFSPDGATLASASDDGRINLWNMAAHNSVGFDGATNEVSSVAFSPDGTILASGVSGGTVKLWDVATWTNIATLEGHEWADVRSVSFSLDGTTLAAGLQSTGSVKLWDVATWTNITTLEGHKWGSHVNSVSFSPNGAMLASGASDNTVKLWDVATWTNIATLEGHTEWVNSVSFSPNGATLASGSADNTVKLWDVATGKNTATLRHHRVTSVSFSPDGAMLASGSGDWDDTDTVKLWDVATRTNIATLEGDDTQVWSVSFSPDGKTLASGSYRIIKLWDVATWTNIATLEGPHSHVWYSHVWSVSFSSDGTTLASGSDDGTILLWDMSKYVTSTPTPALTSDFDGDGTVGISDFLQFVEQFGFSQDDAGYEARFDLDGDGVIGIGDFLIFVNNFGNAGS